MTFERSKKAQQQQAEIYAYGLAFFSYAVAESYHDGLTHLFGQLGRWNYLGKPAEDILPGLRQSLYSRHVVYYLPRDNQPVLIVQVLHVSNDARKHFEDY